MTDHNYYSMHDGGRYHHDHPASSAPPVYYGSQDMQPCYNSQMAVFPNDPYHGSHWSHPPHQQQLQPHASHPYASYVQPPRSLPPVNHSAPSSQSLLQAPPPPHYIPPPPQPPMIDTSWRTGGLYARGIGRDLSPPPPPPKLPNFDLLESIAKKFSSLTSSLEHPPPPPVLTLSSASSTSSVVEVDEKEKVIKDDVTAPTPNNGVDTVVDGAVEKATDVNGTVRTESVSAMKEPDMAAIEKATSLLNRQTARTHRSDNNKTNDSNGSSSSTRSDWTRRRDDKERESTNASSSSVDKRSRDVTGDDSRGRDGRRDDGDRRRRRERSSDRSRRGDRSSATVSTSRRRRSKETTTKNSSTISSRSRRGQGSKEMTSSTRKERYNDERDSNRRSERKDRLKDSSQSRDELRPSDIILNVRTPDNDSEDQEGSGVEIHMGSEEEGEIGEDGTEEEEEEGAESVGDDEEEADEDDGLEDMDIESDVSEGDPTYSMDSHHHQVNQMVMPEDEDDARCTPDIFFPSGPSRRVNHPDCKEAYLRARATASASMNADDRARYSLVLPTLTSRSIFRGLPPIYPPGEHHIGITDPRPKNQHKQTFPDKRVATYDSNPVSTSSLSRPASTSHLSSMYYVSSTKLVRKVPATVSTVPKSDEPPKKKARVEEPAEAVPVSSGASASRSDPCVSISTSDVPTMSKSASAVFSTNQEKQSAAAALLTLNPPVPTSSSSMSSPTPKATVPSTMSANVPSELGVTATLPPPSPLPQTSSLTTHSKQTAIAPRAALSLRRINGIAVTPENRICFEWAQTKNCKAGIFCKFEHGETNGIKKGICTRMLLGLCRGEAACSLPPENHALLPHQLPICKHFLRVQCKHTPEECKLVHIKHNPKVPSCVFFNSGKCTKGDDCTFRHQYDNSVVRTLGVTAEQSRTFVGRNNSKGRVLMRKTSMSAPTSPKGSSSGSHKDSGVSSDGVVDEPEADTSLLDWIV